MFCSILTMPGSMAGRSPSTMATSEGTLHGSGSKPTTSFDSDQAASWTGSKARLLNFSMAQVDCAHVTLCTHGRSARTASVHPPNSTMSSLTG